MGPFDLMSPRYEIKPNTYKLKTKRKNEKLVEVYDEVPSNRSLEEDLLNLYSEAR